RAAFLQHVRTATALPAVAWARGTLDSAGRLHPDTASGPGFGVNM
ncbi:leucyl/phenylalanyl-tRNA--protein transferase, partial [Achromobacter xylosoxidans]